ncbi:hypothetical protein LTR94_005599 [Friedmanniomyces endolithicus]|nr:hypothetical protein LTR94_005599 [Friedmanniomyces endolithicus]
MGGWKRIPPQNLEIGKTREHMAERSFTFHDSSGSNHCFTTEAKMYWRSAAALSLASLSLVDRVCGSLVTVTEYPSACSAVYTADTTSVTVAQSTVTVQPQSWSDAIVNSGTPFVLEVASPSAGSTRKRQLSGVAYLTANGNTTTDGSLATHFRIANGLLTSVNGGYASASVNVMHQPFALFASVGSIETTFAVSNLTLGWNNTAFSSGAAEFFKVPAGLVNNAQVIVRFSGSIDPSWSPILLTAMPGQFSYRWRSSSANFRSDRCLAIWKLISVDNRSHLFDVRWLSDFHRAFGQWAMRRRQRPLALPWVRFWRLLQRVRVRVLRIHGHILWIRLPNWVRQVLAIQQHFIQLYVLLEPLNGSHFDDFFL